MKSLISEFKCEIIKSQQQWIQQRNVDVKKIELSVSELKAHTASDIEKIKLSISDLKQHTAFDVKIVEHVISELKHEVQNSKNQTEQSISEIKSMLKELHQKIPSAIVTDQIPNTEDTQKKQNFEGPWKKP